MPESEHDLEGLISDLRALPAQHRRQVMAALTPFERIHIDALLEERRRADRGAPLADGRTAFSPAIGRALASARAAEAGEGPTPMTDATRRLVLSLAPEAARHAAADADEEAPASRTSLLAAIGNVLAGARR